VSYWLKVSICLYNMAFELLILVISLFYKIIGARHFTEGVIKGRLMPAPF
jgi:hypothetical protein